MSEEYNPDINIENNEVNKSEDTPESTVNPTVDGAYSTTGETETQAETTQDTVSANSTDTAQASTADTTGTQQTDAAADPYSKYNFYQGGQAGQGYQYNQNSQYSQGAPFGQGTPVNPNYYQGYANQAQPGQNYQNPGYGNTYANTGYNYQGQAGQQAGPAGYSTSSPQYNGAYQPSGYPGAYNAGQGYGSQQNPQYRTNPYPAGQVSFVSQVDSIYPGTAPHRTQEKKEKSKAAKFFTGLAMSVAFGAIAAGVFVLITYIYKQQNPDLFNNRTSQVQVTTSEAKNDAHLNLDPAEGTQVPSTSVIDSATFTGTDVSSVVEKNMSAIVAIDCITQSYNYWYGPYDTPTAGSGIILEKNDKELMVATNNHVVASTKDIKVKFIDGTTAPAKIKGKDEISDLAVLSVDLTDLTQETLNAISVATVGNSDDTKVGEMAIAIGNALGYGQSVTVGYISGKDREITIDKQKYTGLLQTDAAINPGNSGGALLNIKGEVIGINNAKIGGSDVEGMGYAIPISRAQDILNEFMSRETLSKDEQGYMGVKVATVTQDMADRYNWPLGVYISSVDKDSAAEKAGLLMGDIITAIDDFDVKDNQSVVEKIQAIRAGTTVTVTIQRREDGEFVEKKIDVTLGNRPTEAPVPSTENNGTMEDAPDKDAADPKKDESKQDESKNDAPDDNGRSNDDAFNYFFGDGFDSSKLPEDFDISSLLPEGIDPEDLPDLFRNGNNE